MKALTLKQTLIQTLTLTLIRIFFLKVADTFCLFDMFIKHRL